MSYAALVLKVLIASPGDVATERQSAREIVQQWNDVNSQDRGIVLMPVAWENECRSSHGRSRPRDYK